VGLYHHDNDDDLRSGIISLKYGRDFWADVLGMSMSLVLLNENLEVDEGALLVSVPSHVDDHPDRDYNPSDMLARRIATYTPTRYGPHILEKMGPNIQKENATSEERFDAVRGLYRATEDIDGQAVVLVDDVMTSGATLSACAEALRIDGADTVHVLVAGRNFHFLEDREYG
jgi:predicted amidophosphoribosyltransferase